MLKPFISIIIPAYNEEQRIGDTLERNLRYLELQKWDWEMIVVSDGSRDKTVEAVDSFARRSSGVRVIDNAENRGKGAAVRQGMLAAKGELRLFMDADNSTPIEELDKLLTFVKRRPENLPVAISGYDVVIGSLSAPGAKIDKRQFFMRVVAGFVGNILIRLLVLPGIYDTQRGFKLFTAAAAEAIFSKLKIERWGFDIEVLALARRLGFVIKEVPVRWSHDPRSKVRPWAYAQVLWELLKIRWWLWTNAYKIGRKTHADYCGQFIPVGGSVLDVGSGRGKFVCEMAKRGFRASGLEMSEEYIAMSKKLALDLGVAVTFVRGPAEKLPFADAVFDFVNCAEVSEHVQSPIEMCHEIYRVLKPGGKCYISFHNRYGVYDYHYALPLINWMPRNWAEVVLNWLRRDKQDSPTIGYQKLSTMHYYRYGAVIELLSALNFKVVDARVAKIKSKFGMFAPIVLIPYFAILRPLYFNTFHVLLERK